MKMMFSMICALGFVNEVKARKEAKEKAEQDQDKGSVLADENEDPEVLAAKRKHARENYKKIQIVVKTVEKWIKAQTEMKMQRKSAELLWTVMQEWSLSKSMRNFLGAMRMFQNHVRKLQRWWRRCRVRMQAVWKSLLPPLLEAELELHAIGIRARDKSLPPAQVAGLAHALQMDEKDRGWYLQIELRIRRQLLRPAMDAHADAVADYWTEVILIFWTLK